VPPQPNNRRTALTTQQVSKIASIFDQTIDDDLAKARTAWSDYQSSRKRDAVYGYLAAVFEIVVGWKGQRRAKANSLQALNTTNESGTIKIDEPFAVVIYCTSDPEKLDSKIRSKWSRALRYAEHFKPLRQELGQFIKSKGGINECADQFSNRLK
jgi:hypothetical protein